MATFRRDHPRKPWHARRKRDRIEFSLGYYPTREAALEAERRWDATWPARRNQYDPITMLDDPIRSVRS